MITVTKEGNKWVARFPFSFEVKDIVKNAGFRFDPASKTWYTTDAMIAAKLDPKLASAAVAKVNADIEASRAVDAAINIPAPVGLSYLPYQKAGIAYAMSRPATLIADEMGLGKTIQALGVVNTDPSIKTVLVICPASLKLNWQREAQKWLVRRMDIGIANGAFPQAQFCIINYDILSKHRDAVFARTWDLLVIDEVHYAKNPKALRTKLVFGSKKDGLEAIPAKRRVFLTGTPIVNRPVELWTLVQALDPADMGRNYMAFCKRYCAAYRSRYGWDMSGASNLPELQQRLRGKFMVRRVKSEVLVDLPPKRRQIIDLSPNGAAALIAQENAISQNVEAAIKAVAEAEAAGNKAAYDHAVMMLKDAQSVAFSEMSRLRREVAVAKIPHVIEHVTDMLDSVDKVVVFCHHLEVAHALRDAFEGCAYVTGETQVDRRQGEVDRFQNDPACRVFIGGIRAAGVGLTLTAASHVVMAELDWTPAGNSQAEDRCHRIGQRDTVFVQHLVFDGSLDARIAQTVVAKQDVIDSAMDRPVGQVAAPEPIALPQGPVAPEPARVQQDGFDLSPIRKMFETAVASGHDRPVFRAEGLVISRAPDHGRNPGALYVKTEANEYLGKLLGTVYSGRPAPGLDVIARDPRAAAVAWGKKASRCSCCGRRLTDPTSVAMGIGPICASNWGI